MAAQDTGRTDAAQEPQADEQIEDLTRRLKMTRIRTRARKFVGEKGANKSGAVDRPLSGLSMVWFVHQRAHDASLHPELFADKLAKYHHAVQQLSQQMFTRLVHLACEQTDAQAARRLGEEIRDLQTAALLLSLMARPLDVSLALTPRHVRVRLQVAAEFYARPMARENETDLRALKPFEYDRMRNNRFMVAAAEEDVEALHFLISALYNRNEQTGLFEPTGLSEDARRIVAPALRELGDLMRSASVEGEDRDFLLGQRPGHGDTRADVVVRGGKKAVRSALNDAREGRSLRLPMASEPRPPIAVDRKARCRLSKQLSTFGVGRLYAVFNGYALFEGFGRDEKHGPVALFKPWFAASSDAFWKHGPGQQIVREHMTYIGLVQQEIAGQVADNTEHMKVLDEVVDGHTHDIAKLHHVTNQLLAVWMAVPSSANTSPMEIDAPPSSGRWAHPSDAQSDGRHRKPKRPLHDVFQAESPAERYEVLESKRARLMVPRMWSNDTSNTPEAGYGDAGLFTPSLPVTPDGASYPSPSDAELSAHSDSGHHGHFLDGPSPPRTHPHVRGLSQDSQAIL